MINENEEVYIDLTRFWDTFKKVWVQCVSLVIVCTIVAYAFSAFLIKPVYTANSRLIIVQQNNTEVSQQISYSDIQLSQKLVNTYTEIARSGVVLDKVIDKLGLRMSVEELNGFLDIKSVNNTEIIDVSVTTEKARLSADIVNEIVSELKKAVVEIMNISNVTILNEAKVPTEKSGPSNVKNAAIGSMIAVVICGGYVVVKTLTDTKVKSEDEVRAIFDYPIIGIIPDVDLNKGKRGGANVD